MVINIRKAKGNKDRQVQLTGQVLNILRVYFKKYNPKEYLFNGQNSVNYSSISIQNIIKHSVAKSKINKRVTPHTLRHSFATHLFENILGHSDIETTQIYTHVTTAHLKNIVNPSDSLDFF
tara:strand:- start:262 stop:624 length:363 start_codon:yes stop_codon:yes gene_type:complete